jgi:4-amino-4-deoxy-L-arabinose transferase-like glycosyltransferase
MVFKTLVDQVSKNFFNYSLQGTAILPQLNQQNYDLPIFFHPPAFVYTALLFSFLPLPLVPVLINLGTIALVFFIGRRLYADDRALWAAFLAAVCPVTWFISQKIWIDNMLILTATASVAAAIWAADNRRPWAYAIAGAVFGLALLSKVTAVLILLPVSRDWQHGRCHAAKVVLPRSGLADGGT